MIISLFFGILIQYLVTTVGKLIFNEILPDTFPFINDGSKDKTWDIIKEINQKENLFTVDYIKNKPEIITDEGALFFFPVFKGKNNKEMAFFVFSACFFEKKNKREGIFMPGARKE